MCCKKSNPTVTNHKQPDCQEGVAKGPEKIGNHKDTKTQSFFGACLSYAWQANKVFLCAFVPLWFKAFMLFATVSQEGVSPQKQP